MSWDSDPELRTRWYITGFVAFLIFCAFMGEVHGPGTNIEDDTGICMRPTAQLGC